MFPCDDLPILEREGFRSEYMSGFLVAMGLHVPFGNRATLLQVGGADENLLGTAKAFRAECKLPFESEQTISFVTTDVRDIAALGIHLRRLAASMHGDRHDLRSLAQPLYRRGRTPISFPFANPSTLAWNGASRAGFVVLMNPASVHGDDYLRWRNNVFPISEPAVEEAPAP